MIHQMEPWIGDEERKAVDAYLSSGGWLIEYRQTEQFARMVCDYVGARHCSILPNGTITLFAILASLGIGPSDEVLVPDYTMIASANAVVLAGGRPVFIDVDPRTLCMDLNLAEAAITKRTRAIMLVSMNGRSPDMEHAVELARCHQLALVEDAAQSLGSSWRGRHLGTFGIAGSFSFSPQKIITTGQGGAIVTDDDEMAHRIAQIRDFGRRQRGVDVHDSIGYNFKFTDIQAVIGIEQMKKLEWRVRRKREIFDLYRSFLKDIEQVQFLETDLDNVTPWFVDIQVPDPLALKAHLAGKEIGSRVFYPPIHSQPAYGQPGFFPNTELAAGHGLWLPSSSALEDVVIERICSEIKAFYN
jgi:perosamine synthetase